MSEVTRLIPKRQIAAEVSLGLFIDEAKGLEAFGKGLDFESNVWRVTDFLNQKSKRAETHIAFGAWGEPRASKNVSPRPMAEPFLSFAKAYVLWEYDSTGKVSMNRDIQAVRAIENALAQSGTANPVLLTAAILNNAASLVRSKYSRDGAHGIGATIEHIANLVDDKGIGGVPLQWRNPIPAPGSRTRVGTVFDNRRADKIPSARILEALGRAYRAAVNPEDVIYCSMTALMLSSPDRSNEVASMLVDCESSTRGDGTPGYALRWWPSKNAAPQLKAIPEIMQDVVQEAIGKIKRETDKAREIARWYECQITPEHPMPSQIYIPDHLSYLRTKEFITRKEISLLLWGEDGHEMDSWCKSKKIAGFPIEKSKTLVHRFADVEKAILGCLPQHFPYSDNTKRWKCSELLFTMLKYANKDRRPLSCMYVPMDRADLNYRLNGRNRISIFANLGLNDVENGEFVPFQVTPHQFRHYLNHLAHTTGEMSEIDINLWSGRTQRGEEYNHMSSEEISRMSAKLLGKSLPNLPAVSTQQHIKMYVRAEYKRLGISSGHTTDFGYCIHDFSATPCQKHEDCLDCNEQFCVKGDSEKEANLRREQDELRYLVAKAEVAVGGKIYKADRWLDRQKVNLARVNAILEIIENPNVLQGTPIRLTGLKNYSRIEHARDLVASEPRSTTLENEEAVGRTESQKSFSLLSRAKPGLLPLEEK